WGPLWWHVAGYLWHLAVLPAALAGLLGAWIWRGAIRRRRARPHDAAPATSRQFETGGTTGGAGTDTVTSGTTLRPSRRGLLRTTAIAIPPLVGAVLTVRAEWALRTFRVRRLEVFVPTLPVDLDGLRIAHVSDLHVGQFLPSGMAGRVVDATNALGADLVAFTGDLMDISADRIAPGLDFVRRIDPRQGLALVQGNHDGMTDADKFEQPVREAGLPLLQDQGLTCRVSGRQTAVQFLGMRWGDLRFGRELDRTGRDAGRRFRVRSDAATRDSVARITALRTVDAFPIVLTHHPHDFDLAADAGFPLVLAGHTHGGQLMLTERVGVGPLRFRYWSGTYGRGASRLVVSNGVGNWFPLRLNAPPEIGLITLRRGVSQPS
ncbi:MAG TPA: metallophosphoesterase, partial [Tepidisphaeraceae bacterium]|nr:metallophosphoesterase [Tepidisphaeraceae bacterium]